MPVIRRVVKRTRGTVGVFAKGYLPDLGGIERYSADICDAYRQRYDRVYVITQTSVGPSVTRKRNMILVDVGSGSQISLLFRFAAVSRRIFSKVKPNFFHATTWRMALPALFHAGSVPLVVTVHGREVFIVPIFLRPLMRCVLARSAVVAVVSNAIRNAYAAATKTSTDHWVTVWNGISFREQAEKTGKRAQGELIRLYTFCRLVERKNVRAAIEAVNLLKQRGVGGFIFEIAGDGPERIALEELVNCLGLSAEVNFLGYISEEDVVNYYRTSHIFVHPQIASHGGGDIEGFGLTIADAMSFGLAVVVGQAGGPSDFVIDGETGLVVDGHDITAIADALQRLIESMELRGAIAQQGQKWALSELDWVKSVSQISVAVGAMAHN